jgi:hypothetical protein
MPKTKPRTPARPKPSATDLKRWCIEQASRWPTNTEGGGGGGSYGGMGYRYVDADLIGRAQKIFEWVAK